MMKIMNYKSIARSVVLIVLVTVAYYIGEHRGLKKGVEIASLFAQSGRAVGEANTIALLLGFSRRGEEVKMYEWGEKFLLMNMETYNNIQGILEQESRPVKGTELYELLDVMVNSFPSETTSYYLETYVYGDQVGTELLIERQAN